ncbi:14517_t:CDS:2 [Funneliformis caledonium]|uniref:14517_t:CDS:1 n=1 Tax=Funneliformis caledonium TaxID=1117310 RepID=A0A9N9GLL0_9GLOM|nr:14517_t:CDS:2 [Funneliformis caledonium]
MPQSGTGVSIEAVDPKNVGYVQANWTVPKMVVGWYHSHPGFGCWLSSSVKGKVVIDAFRLINPQMLMLGQEPRQTTSNIGHLNKPSIQALIHGSNRHYYSIAINYRKNELEQKMLLNLHKKIWTHGLTLPNFTEHTEINGKNVKCKDLDLPFLPKKFCFFDLLMKKFRTMLTLAEPYNKSVQEDSTMTPEQLKTRYVGKQDQKRHLEESGRRYVQ